MAFAIFYEPVDLTAIATHAQANQVPNALKKEALKYWNAGLKDYETAPLGASPYDNPIGCPN